MVFDPNYLTIFLIGILYLKHLFLPYAKLLIVLHLNLILNSL